MPTTGNRRCGDLAISLLSDRPYQFFRVGVGSPSKLKERSVRVDGELAEDGGRMFGVGYEGVLQVGKRTFARVLLKGV